VTANHQRRNRHILLALLLCLVTTGVSLRIRQRLIRIHVQHALNNLQHLNIGASASASCGLLREWRGEWGSSVTSEGSCDDPRHFYVRLHAQHPPYFVPFCFERQFGLIRHSIIRGMCATYDVLSGTAFAFDAQIEAANGCLTKKSSSVFVVVADDSPEADLPAYLHASAEVPAQLAKRRSSADSQSDLEQQDLHSNYRVFVGTSIANADSNPGGKIFYTEVEIGPAGSTSDSERLSRFDLSCVTRMRPCSRRDLMPAAFDQNQMDLGNSRISSPNGELHFVSPPS
jgi:hypothetical protein